MTYNRREFLKNSGLAAALLPLADLESGEPVSLRLARNAARQTKIPTLCGMCRWRCPLLITLRQGRIDDISGNADFSPTGGRCCARALAAVRLLEDPDRLRYPVRRLGERGSGQWQRIDWEEAIDTIAQQLQSAATEQQRPLFAGGPSAAYLRELWQEMGGVVIDSDR